MSLRQIYLVLTLLCFALCVAIVLFLSNASLPRGTLGDILIVMMLYFGLKTVYNFHAVRLAGGVLGFAFAVEFSQALNLIEHLGLQNNALAQVVLGATFDPLDLIAYTLGALLAYWADIMLTKSKYA